MHPANAVSRVIGATLHGCITQSFGKSLKSLLMLGVISFSANTLGQALLNPDLDNATGEAINDAPDNWTIIAGTPDVVDGSDTGGVCNDSDVDVCGNYASGTSNTLFTRLRNSNNSGTCGTLTERGLSNLYPAWELAYLTRYVFSQSMLVKVMPALTHQKMLTCKSRFHRCQPKR